MKRMNIACTLIFTIVLTMLGVKARAYTYMGTADGICYNFDSYTLEATVQYIVDKASAVSVIVPEELDIEYDYYISGVAHKRTARCRVVAIGSSAFSECSNLVSVSLPNSINTIGNRAFYNCSSLLSIQIPNDVQTIESNTFYGCANLHTISLPNNLSIVKGSAFQNCSSLESVSFPSKLKNIQDWAFYNCSGLQSITLPDGLLTIGQKAFFGCKSLTAVSIPGSVQSIGDNAFFGSSEVKKVTIGDGDGNMRIGKFAFCDTRLKTVDIGSGVSEIGESAFSVPTVEEISLAEGVKIIKYGAFFGCEGVKSVKIPNSVETIGEKAFQNCANLQELRIGHSVVSIENDAFNGCPNLEVLVLGNSVREIGARAFYNTTLLESLVLPASITKIGDACFQNCNLIKELVIPSSVTQIGYSAFRDWSALENLKIIGGQVPLKIQGSVFRECSALKKLVIGSGVSEIGSYAFGGCANIEELEIPNTVRSIGDKAFVCCYKLSSLIIGLGEGEMIIGKEAFDGCQSLMSLQIGASVSEIGEEAFKGCQNLESISISPQDLTIKRSAFGGCSSLKTLCLENQEGSLYINDYAFTGCGNLLSLDLGRGIKNIGAGAFYGCGNLQSLSIDPAEPLDVYYRAFYGCKKMTNLILGDNVGIIGQDAFNGCYSLSQLILGRNVTEIGNGAFSGCYNLEELSIGENVTKIGSGAFGTEDVLSGIPSNEKLHSLTIPGNVKSIGSGAFLGYRQLESLVIEDGVEIIGEVAFAGCSNMKQLVLPKTLKEIKGGVFKYCNNLTELDIPESVKVIADEAFMGCNQLKDLIFGSELVIIGKKSFLDCNSLNTLVVPNSVSTIGQEAFSGCFELENLTLPAGLDEIAFGTFSGCKKLVELNIPKRVHSIGDYAFYNCNSLAQLSLKTDDSGISTSLDKSIGNYAFANCINLEKLSIGDNVSCIGDYAFSGCAKLSSLSVPKSVKTIGDYSFNGCASMSELMLSCSKISKGSFQNCGNLKKITFGSDVEEIGSKAFYNCTGLEEIYCQVEDPIDIDLSVFSYDYKPYMGISTTMFNSSPALYVSDVSKEKYINHDVWGLFNLTPQLIVVAYEGVNGRSDTEQGLHIDGVTADGRSKLFLAFDRQLNNIESWTTTCYIGDEECNNVQLTGSFGQVEKLKDQIWGISYTAPNVFPSEYGEKNAYAIMVKAEIVADGVLYHSKGYITVMRPGVVLLHGFLSDRSCFQDLRSALTGPGGYEKYQVLNLDYQQTNQQSFFANTEIYQVVQKRIEKLYSNLLQNGIVSSKYDIVGHSMGGILARMFVQYYNRNSESGKTIGQLILNPVNRIITLDTPHYGSELSDLATEKVLPFVDNLISLLKARVKETNETIIDYEIEGKGTWKLEKDLEMYSLLLDFIEESKRKLAGYDEENAIKDLSPSSEAIRQLNENAHYETDVPVHAICSFLEESSTWNLGSFLLKAVSGNGIVMSSIGYLLNGIDYANSDQKFLKTVFHDNNHDGIVSYPSQRGGLTGHCFTDLSEKYNGLFGMSSNAHHCKTNHWSRTFDKIEELLKRPITSNCFAKGFSPGTVKKAIANNSCRKQKVAASNLPDILKDKIQLSLEKEDTARVLRVCIAKDEDIKRVWCFAKIDEDNILSGIDNDVFRFQIPETFSGTLSVCVIGLNQQNDVAMAVDTVSYSPQQRLDYMFFTNHDVVELKVGETFRREVVAGWSSGDETYIRPEYSVDVDSILSVVGNKVKATKVGHCMLYASYLDITDSVRVVVKPNNIVFADSVVKRICVDKWDADGDNELSVDEAAAVTEMNKEFEYQYDILSFDELHYFTNLQSIVGTFNFCNHMSSIKLPASLEIIGDYTFSGCQNLTGLEIPENVTSIGSWAFDYCTRLEKISIPANVVSIGIRAFQSCNSLIRVEVGQTTPIAIEENTFTNRKNATLCVPKGCREVYMNAPYWNEFMNIVEAGEDIITVVGDLNTVKKQENKERYYDLLGRKTLKGHKGVYIKSKKKHLIPKVCKHS